MTTTKHPAMALISISFIVAALAMMFSSVNTALAAIQGSFGSTLGSLHWVMNSFGITLTSSVVFAGQLADRYGRKKMFIIAGVLAFLSLLLSSNATNMTTLIIAQSILGVAGGIVIPVSQALMASTSTPEHTPKIIGIWASVVGIAMGVGPIVSGYLITSFSWRGIFILSLVVVVLGLVGTIAFAPETKQPDKRSLDFYGAILLFITVASIITTFDQVVAWSGMRLYTLVIVAVLAVIGLIYRERTLSSNTQPVLHIELLKKRKYICACLANSMTIFYAWAIFFLAPYYLQTLYKMSAHVAGLYMLAITVPLTICSFIGGRMFAAFGPKLLMLLGFVCLAVSCYMQVGINASSESYYLILALALGGLGWGLAWGPSTTVAISSLPQEQAGVASGPFVTIQELGGGLGLAVTGSLFGSYKNLVHGYSHCMIMLTAVAILGFIFSLGLTKKALAN